MNSQTKAHSWANRHIEKLLIVKECSHQEKKYKHHPDYSQPFLVHLLCAKCHGKERKNLSKSTINRKELTNFLYIKLNGFTTSEKINELMTLKEVTYDKIGDILFLSPTSVRKRFEKDKWFINDIYRISKEFAIDPRSFL